VAEASGVTLDLSAMFTKTLSRNRGLVPGDPDARRPPDYGVSALLEGRQVTMTLTFRAGSAYCCYETGCHLDLHEGRRWEGLRRELASLNLEPEAQLSMRLTTIIEPGALFFDFARPDPKRRSWYAFRTAPGRRVEQVIREGDG
jgi:hypothetical protein